MTRQYLLSIEPPPFLHTAEFLFMFEYDLSFTLRTAYRKYQKTNKTAAFCVSLVVMLNDFIANSCKARHIELLLK